MHQKIVVACASVALVAFSLACSNDSDSPVSPSASEGGASEAAADGSTLKASAPVPQSPVNNQQPDQLVFVANRSTATYAGAAVVFCTSLRFATAAIARRYVPLPSSRVVQAPPSPTRRRATWSSSRTHTWRVRAAHGNARGPWRPPPRSEAPAGGYIRGNEVYDPLINGKTVGEIHGPVTFIPGVGVRLETHDSYIQYRLPQTLVQGEFSLIITNVATNTEGGKTKVFAMSEGLDDIVTNDRRMTVEKRGDPEGIVAWRFISHEDQIDTEGAEREFVEFDPNQAYLWTATWNGAFHVRIQRGGANGPTVYNKGKGYRGAYDPEPHYAFIGSTTGRTGPEGATVPGMIVRQVWISPHPRPGNIGQ